MEKYREFWTFLGIAGNLGLLCVYKYAAFFLSTWNAVLPFEIPVPQIALPIGISFFIFQSISYVIDVARKETEAQKNPFYLLLLNRAYLYVFFQHQVPLYTHPVWLKSVL